MIRIYLQLSLIFFLIPLSSQADFKEKYVTPIYNDHVKPTVRDGFDQTGWWILGAGTLATVASIQYDEDVREFWEGKGRIPTTYNNIGNKLGSGGPSIMVLATQLLFDRNNGWKHAETLIGVRISKTLIKRTVRRKRPSNDELDTLPSGHVSTIVATVTSLTYSYGWVAGVPGYALSVLASASRLNDTRHFLSDLVAAAFLGFFWGRAPHKHHSKETSELKILPDVDGDQVGLLLEYRF